LACSKISSDALKDSIANVLKHATETKPRKFTETVELQIGLKGYDPSRDKVGGAVSGIVVRFGG
jgi:large subunit ribosomal protein L10Ae